MIKKVQYLLEILDFLLCIFIILCFFRKKLTTNFKRLLSHILLSFFMHDSVESPFHIVHDHESKDFQFEWWNGQYYIFSITDD